MYSIPHFSFTMVGFPVSSCRNGLGLTGTFCGPARRRGVRAHSKKAGAREAGQRRSSPPPGAAEQKSERLERGAETHRHAGALPAVSAKGGSWKKGLRSVWTPSPAKR